MSNQPKIAVLMMGNMRSYNITSKNLEAHLLAPYNCDLYITTYDKRFNAKFGSAQEEIMTDLQISGVYGKYVKQITIINQESFTEKYTTVKDKPYKFGGEINRLYTIQKLVMTAYDIFRGECARNNRHYDYIVKIRPDALLNEKLNLGLIINENQIVVPSNNSGGCFNDHMAFGKHKAMTKYMTYYRSFGDVDRLDCGKACDVSVIEDGLKKHLEVSKIEIVRHPIKYTILRDIKPQKIVFTGGRNGQFYIKKY